MPQSIRIGSQLFINKDDSPERVRSLVRLMKRHELELIRLFVFWDHVEPRPGVWEFANYDACFDEADRQRMGVVPTLMSVSPPGWMKLSGGPQSYADLDAEHYFERSAAYIDRLVTRYRDRPSLDSWILWNEASRKISRNDNSVRAFIRFMRDRYDDDISLVNRAYFHQFGSFEELASSALTGNPNAAEFKIYAEWLDWLRFSVDNLTAQLRKIRDRIRLHDPDHPIHVNPHALQSDLHASGQSIWREREVVDFLGCSAHPVHHSTRFPVERWGQSVAFFADLMKSATPDPDRKFWVTELQGGMALFSGGIPYNPGRETIRRWMWEGIASGAKAVVFWSFNARNNGWEAGEWAMLNRLEEPSPRLDAAREVSAFLKEHDPIFAGTSPERAGVTVYYSEKTWALGTVEGKTSEAASPRNRNMYADAAAGAYMLFSDLSYEVDFINESLLLEPGALQHTKLLVLPNIVCMSERELEVVQAFTERGGTVIADGLPAWKDADGRLDQGATERAERLFGCRVEDVEIDSGPIALFGECGSRTFDGWFYRAPLRAGEHSRAIAAFGDGRPAATRYAVGAGCALRIGTLLFQHYFVYQPEASKKWLGHLIAGVVPRCAELQNGDWTLRLRQLEHERGKVLVLIHYGDEAASARIRFDADGIVRDLHDKRDYPVAAGQLLELSVGEAPVRVYFWEPSGNC
ncbi:beta-galactosidase [Paenibacillus oceani]|uniref:beta-galactosidase n=1 Tax=Paenibacillus oceani TaxID=2772510 RepID=A0A927C9P5_9BACL|nr:beta-galactosidase [Paenibacillus oceani]MBD2862688.1 beta-galactosidase [Paenibacillus oceani]